MPLDKYNTRTGYQGDLSVGTKFVDEVFPVARHIILQIAVEAVLHNHLGHNHINQHNDYHDLSGGNTKTQICRPFLVLNCNYAKL